MISIMPYGIFFSARKEAKAWGLSHVPTPLMRPLSVGLKALRHLCGEFRRPPHIPRNNARQVRLKSVDKET